MLNRLDLRGAGADLIDRLPRPTLDGDEPVEIVRQLIARVRSEGDAALVALTEQFDGVALDAPRVLDAELDAAVAGLEPSVRAALDTAIANVDAFHQHQVRQPEIIQRDGMTIRASQKPMRRVGLYAPGGRAVYPSTVVMSAVIARVAGCEQIVLCVPPSRDHGGVHPTVLAAARLSGVDEVYAVGGAQAIAAMAYGTETVAPVDVIAGPGNIYVALAKREVSGDVGIAAAFAGPSEVVVVADGSIDPRYAAIDVMLQAEHGPDGLAWLVTADAAVADAVCAAGEELLRTAPRADDIRSTLAEGGYVAIVDDLDDARRVVDAIGPEHLELQIDEPDRFADQVNNAGAIFCGAWSPASVGDYVAGPSHVLPTYGSARFASALTVADFTKDHHVVTLDPDGLRHLGPHTVALAEVEGLDAHAESVRLRLEDLG